MSRSPLIIQGEFFFTDERSSRGSAYVARYRERMDRNDLLYLAVRFYDRQELTQAIFRQHDGVSQNLIDRFRSDLARMIAWREAVVISEKGSLLTPEFMDVARSQWLKDILRDRTYYPVFTVFLHAPLKTVRPVAVRSVFDREVQAE